MRVVFFGTPDFAVPSLTSLADTNDVVLVVTQPDRPKGRGLKTIPTPVKAAALGLGLDVVQADKITTELIGQVKERQPDIIAVSAFGLFLPKKLCKLPKYACINVHPSLLPAYRGAAPVQWAVINGEKETGVSIMYVAPKLDAGDVILQEKEPILQEDTAQTLMDRLAVKGGRLLIKAIRAFDAGKVVALPQDHTKVTWARSLTKEDGRISWEQSPERIRDLVRGVVPWPGAFTTLPDGRIMKVHPHVKPVPLDETPQPGTLIKRGKAVVVACGHGGVELSEVQLPGKKRTLAAALLNGGALKPDMRFGV